MGSKSKIYRKFRTFNATSLTFISWQNRYPFLRVLKRQFWLLTLVHFLSLKDKIYCQGYIVMKLFTAFIAFFSLLMTQVASANDGSGSEVKIPAEVLQITSGNLPVAQQVQALHEIGFIATTLPVQMRTAYAVGGLERCETVISLTNFSGHKHSVEVEFFTGFSFLKRGIAKLSLQSGETGEVATTNVVRPFIINDVRDSSVPFEGYAIISSKTSEIGAHAHMVCENNGGESYQDINVFKYKKGKATQVGD